VPFLVRNDREHQPNVLVGEAAVVDHRLCAPDLKAWLLCGNGLRLLFDLSRKPILPWGVLDSLSIPSRQKAHDEVHSGSLQAD
jgi:hypothetical protein